MAPDLAHEHAETERVRRRSYRTLVSNAPARPDSLEHPGHGDLARKYPDWAGVRELP